MTNRELVDCVANLGLSKLKLNMMLRRHHMELFNEIVKRTKFLDDSCIGENSWRTVPILARLHCLEHDLTKMPVCANPDCSNILFWSKGGSSFHKHCCKRCSNSDPDVMNPKKGKRNQFTSTWCRESDVFKVCVGKGKGNLPQEQWRSISNAVKGDTREG